MHFVRGSSSVPASVYVPSRIGWRSRISVVLDDGDALY